MSKYQFNPKCEGSGIIGCVPQTDECPNNCPDCFFQSGRSYLEPLNENLPNVPSLEMARGRVVRINDGHDSNVEREWVESVAQRFDDYFFNTSIPHDLGGFSGPVVLTVNPGDMTDIDFHKLDPIPSNLMFVRVRVNMWNLGLVDSVVKYYANQIIDHLNPDIEYVQVPIVLTFMAYYTQLVSKGYEGFYEYKKRTLNSYWCITQTAKEAVEYLYKDNPFVYSCGWKDVHGCSFCGNCLREYYAAKERLRNEL